MSSGQKWSKRRKLKKLMNRINVAVQLENADEDNGELSWLVRED